MTLQSMNLVMVGLGIRDDAPPVPEQPKLRDGVHLRWSTPRSRSFPWFGFFLYRRPANKERGVTACLETRGLVAQASATTHVAPDGTLSSPVPLAFTDDFAPTGAAEIDLRSRPFIRFDRPLQNLANEFRVRIGFRRQTTGIHCIDFDAVAVERLPIAVQGMHIVATPSARSRTHLLVARPPVDGSRGKQADKSALVMQGVVDATLPDGADWVELDISGTGAAFAIETLTKDKRARSRKRFAGKHGARETVRFATAGLSGLRIRASDASVWIHRICFPIAPARPETITVEGLALLPGDDPGFAAVVARRTITGMPGETVDVVVAADRMTGVRVSGGNAAIIQLCWSDLAIGATRGWSRVPKCPAPLALPVRHPDYPAWPGPVDVAVAEGEALGRVRYGPASDWQGPPFKALHEQCEALVAGGPSASPMSDPSRALPALPAVPAPAGMNAPILPSIHPLDLVVLGAVHPPFAEMLGLAWTDETVTPGQRFDYLIVADHDGVSAGDSGKLLDFILANGFVDGVDGWIVFDQSIAPRPPLDPPAEVRVHALPGGTVRPDPPGTTIEHIAGSAGLTWPSAMLPYGGLQPGAPVVHHLWRGDAGNGTTPALPSEAGDWLTRNRPLMASMPTAPPLTPMTAPADWPPFEFNYVDFRLAEGWYVYQLVGVDIFGRFSRKSAFAPWWQWAPEPTPRPWYYVGSSVAAVVNPAAVHILDKARPPVPIGLEAFVLDPGDPILVQDAAYMAWRASLGPGGAATAGLRVRWRWTAAQQVSAPGVAEFRLYWSPGTSPPADWGEPESWPSRFFVCPFNQNVTVVAGERRYDVFLPVPAGTVFPAGVPLAPSLAVPIAYANVSITAADAVAHTPDRWPGGGAFAGRVGNESGCAPPQRVFRVWREEPPPPAPIVDSDKVYATAADWRSLSYHTFRWAPQPHLRTHVCRAIDEAVFEADWALQPRPPLGTADPAFPDAAAEPIWTAAKKGQVAGLIDAIRALLGAAPTPAEKAAAKPAAFLLYRALTDDALRVLASRAGSERAFVQVTVTAIDAPDAPDRRGPDDPAGYVPSGGRCAFIDAVDGRATNRLLYRALFVDGAQNRSVLGACGTPVRLPDTTAPRAPTIGKALGGDRAVTLTWASNREADLLEYRILRAMSEADARDLRTMTPVGVVAADPDPAARPARVEWTDAAAPGRKDLWYRVVAIDRTDPDPRGGGGNWSAPSPAMRARAFDDTPPVPPAIATLDWVRVDDTGTVFPFADPIPDGAERLPAVRITWPAAAPDVKLLVQVKPESSAGFGNASAWLPPGTSGFVHRTDHTFEPLEYRLKVVNGAGNANAVFAPSSLAPAP